MLCSPECILVSPKAPSERGPGGRLQAEELALSTSSAVSPTWAFELFPPPGSFKEPREGRRPASGPSLLLLPASRTQRQRIRESRLNRRDAGPGHTPEAGVAVSVAGNRGTNRPWQQDGSRFKLAHSFWCRLIRCLVPASGGHRRNGNGHPQEEIE